MAGDPGTPARLFYNFSIVGSQKAGTTTLMSALEGHPQVRRSRSKEPHFFDNEKYDWSAPDYEADYSMRRKNDRQIALGDATPAYLFWPGALERMRAYNPDMRLVALFRDPLERIFSHWAMVRAQNPKAPDWPQFIRLFPRATLPDALPAQHPGRYRRLAGVHRGLYGAQVERGLRIFDASQWLFLEFREMLANWEQTLNQTTDHLGLNRFENHPAAFNGYPGADLVLGTAPTVDDLQRLARKFEHDMGLLHQLTGLDVSHWPTARILDGALDPAELAVKLGSRVTQDPLAVTQETHERRPRNAVRAQGRA